MIIRNAVIADDDMLIALGQTMAQESPHFRKIEYNAEKARAYLHRCIFDAGHLALVAEHENEIVGFFLAFTQDYYLSDAVFAEDAALYVRPEWRGRSVAQRLIKAYVDWAEGLGVAHCYMGTNTGVKADKALALFERCGFTPLGYTLVREV